DSATRLCAWHRLGHALPSDSSASSSPSSSLHHCCEPSRIALEERRIESAHSVDLVIVSRAIVHPLHRFRLVQESRHPRTTHEEDAAFGCHRNEWLPALTLLACWSVSDDDEAWKDVPLEVGDRDLPRAARLLL